MKKEETADTAAVSEELPEQANRETGEDAKTDTQADTQLDGQEEQQADETNREADEANGQADSPTEARPDTESENRPGAGKVRTGSRYDPENIKTGSRYDREKAQALAKALEEREAGHSMERFAAQLKAGQPLAIVLFVAAILLIIGYLVGAVYFSGHFYPGTTILGVNCTGKDTAWVKEQVQERVEGYTLNLKERYGVSEALSGQSIGMRYADDGAIERRLRGQWSALWPLMMFIRRGSDTQITTEYDEGRVRGALLELGCFRKANVVEPVDAHIEETDEGYVIVPEEMGTKLDIDRTTAAAKEALDREESELILEFKDCYIDPEVYADDAALGEELDARNALLGADLTYDFVDRSEHVDTRKLMEWIVPDGNGGYQFDEEAVYRYANVLADTYDTYGGTRTFHTSIGTDVTLYGGDYGWAMDRDSTAWELLQAIREKRTGNIEPVYMYTAKDRSSNDIGDTYVEICIDLQEMWCYKDGELIVDTPVVTGNPSKGNATPAGSVWAIDAKMTDYVLIGEGYRSPVDFWMPFNGNIGIHDMQSRYYFGGTIYLTHGSHGCVNTPLDAVEQIYNAVEEGTPVIVYEEG